MFTDYMMKLTSYKAITNESYKSLLAIANLPKNVISYDHAKKKVICLLITLYY